MSQDKSKDGNLQGEANTPPTYKEQLDEAAIKVKDPQNGADGGGVIDQVVEKVSQYVPAIKNVLGKDQKEDPASQEPKVPGPPERPHHDTQIEEFIKDQHSSKKDDGTLN